MSFNTDPNTASGAYGFASWTPAVPGGAAILPETQIGTITSVPGQVLGSLGPHPAQNPLFWVLVIALLWTGYLYGGFNVSGGAKRIGGGRAGVNLGRR